MPFVPRGRWALLRYSRPAVERVSDLLDIYSVVTPGSGTVGLAPGDLVLTRSEHLVQAGKGYAYGQAGEGIIALWNDAFNEPILMFGSLYLHVVDVHEPNDETVGYFDDIRALRVLNVDGAITDIAPNDIVLVARRSLVSVGARAEERFVTMAEDILAKLT